MKKKVNKEKEELNNKCSCEEACDCQDCTCEEDACESEETCCGSCDGCSGCGEIDNESIIQILDARNKELVKIISR